MTPDQHPQSSRSSSSSLRLPLLALAIVILLRYVTLGIPGLIDSTEGRYATVAKLMFDRGDPLVPLINAGHGVVPYLGKPPLHFWFVMIAYWVFGVSTFAARFPSFIAMIGILITLWIVGARLWNRNVAVWSCLFFASSLFPFALSGSCLLDITFTAFVTIATGGLFIACMSERKIERSVWFFVSAISTAAGFLVKGPLAPALVFLVTGSFWLLNRRVIDLKEFPWTRSIMYAFAVIFPWFAAMEISHPGFLKYFFINENLLRFTSEDYGDKYGTGHDQIFGTSWVFTIAAFFPWTAVLLAVCLTGAFRNPRQVLSSSTNWLRTCFSGSDKRSLYLLLWGLWTPLLFTFAHQLTGTYVIPAIPALALLLASCVDGNSKFRECCLPILYWTLLVALTAIAVVPIVGLFYRGPWMLLGISVVGGTVIYFEWSKRCLTSLTFQTSAALLTLSTVGLYTVIVFGFGNYVSQRRSSEVLMAGLRALPNLSKLPGGLAVGFSDYSPFSAYFYDTVGSSPKVDVATIPSAEIMTRLPGHVVVHQKFEANLPPTIASVYQKQFSSGPWQVYQRIR